MLYFNNNPVNALNFGGNRVAQVDYKSSPSASAITVWKAKRTITSAQGSYALSSSLSEAPFYTQTGSSSTIVDAVAFNGVSVVLSCDNESVSTYGYGVTLRTSTNGISWNTVAKRYSAGAWFSKIIQVNNTLYFFYFDEVNSSTDVMHVCKSTDGITWTNTTTNLTVTPISIIPSNCQLVYNNGQFHFLYNPDWYSSNPDYQVVSMLTAYASSDGANWVISEFNDANCIQRAPAVTSPHFGVHMEQLFSPTGDGNWYALMRNRIYPYPISTSDAYDLYYVIKSNDLINWTYDSDFDTPNDASNVGILGLIGSAESPVYLNYVLNGATTVMDMRTKTVASASFLPAGIFGKSFDYTPEIETWLSNRSFPKLVTNKDIFILSVYADGTYTHYYSNSLTASVWNVINAVPDTSKPLIMVCRDN